MGRPAATRTTSFESKGRLESKGSSKNSTQHQLHSGQLRPHPSKPSGRSSQRRKHCKSHSVVYQRPQKLGLRCGPQRGEDYIKTHRTTSNISNGHNKHCSYYDSRYSGSANYAAKVVRFAQGRLLESLGLSKATSVACCPQIRVTPKFELWQMSVWLVCIQGCGAESELPRDV